MMSKNKKEIKPAEGDDKATITKEFTQLNGKISNLLKAERDAKVYLTSHYLVPIEELKTGIPIDVSEYIQRVHDLHPYQELELEEDNCLTDEQEDELFEIRTDTYCINQKRRTRSKLHRSFETASPTA